MAQGTWIRNSSLWLPVKRAYIRDASTWRLARYGWIRTGGAWQPCYSAQPMTASSVSVTNPGSGADTVTFLASATLTNGTFPSHSQCEWRTNDEGTVLKSATGSRDFSVSSVPEQHHQYKFRIRQHDYNDKPSGFSAPFIPGPWSDYIPYTGYISVDWTDPRLAPHLTDGDIYLYYDAGDGCDFQTQVTWNYNSAVNDTEHRIDVEYRVDGSYSGIFDNDIVPSDLGVLRQWGPGKKGGTSSYITAIVTLKTVGDVFIENRNADGSVGTQEQMCS